MLTFLLGIALFFGPHSYSAFRSRRPTHDLRARRELPYMVVYSLLSLVGLVLIARGYQAMEAGADLYTGPDWAWIVSAVLMWPAFILFAAGNGPGGHIRHAVGYPMVLGTAIWAGVHLLGGATGRQLLLFGPFFLWAVADYALARRRPRPSEPPRAVADAAAIGLGTLSYLIFILYAHAAWIGASPIGQPSPIG